MKEIKQDTYKGTRILFGNGKRHLIDSMCSFLIEKGYTEISIPIIQPQTMFAGKVGDNGKIMYNFTDRGNRALCLAPEYTGPESQIINGLLDQLEQITQDD